MCDKSKKIVPILEQFHVNELKNIARKCKIKEFSTKRKSELIKILLDYADQTF